MRYIQRKDEEGFEVPSGTRYRIACCDCGLVHDFVFVSHDKKSIGIAARRNNRATAAKRRKKHPKGGDIVPVKKKAAKKKAAKKATAKKKPKPAKEVVSNGITFGVTQ